MFENIPKNWEKVALENLLEYEQPTNYIVASEEYNDSYPTPVLTAGKSFILGYTNETEGIYQNTPVIIFDDFTTESKFVDFEFKVKSSAMKILKAKDNDTLKYLYYLMQILPFNNTQHKRYWISEYSKIKIGIPKDINEVKEIVKVLDAASEIIRLRTACIESAQSLIPALFQEMFGDINNNIHSLPISEIKSCVEINPTKIVINDNDDVTFLGMKDVTENGQIDLSTIKKYEEVKKGFTSFKNDDVLLAKITPCFENGKAAIAKNLVNNTGFGSTEFYVLRPNQNKILPDYLYSIVKSSRFSEMGRSNMKGAAGQKRLIKDFVSNYKFLLPDIPQQKLFAAKVQEIEAYIKTQQVELENTKTMFQFLLHHSFTGELTRRAYEE